MTHITQRLADALRRRRVYMSAKLHKQFVIPEIDALLSEYDANPAHLYTQAELDEAVAKERERCAAICDRRARIAGTITRQLEARQLAEEIRRPALPANQTAKRAATRKG